MSQQHDSDDDNLPELDAALLAQSMESRCPEPERAALMKARILSGIAQGGGAAKPVPTKGALTSSTVRVGERRWHQVARGVEMCTLHEDAFSRSVLLRMQPDSFLLPHRHEMSEESLILEGDALIGEDLQLNAGDYHFSSAGTVHPLLQSPGGCVVYVKGEKGFSPRLTTRLFKRLLRRRSARSE